jgi:uncharacterized membrane protein YfcA
MLFTGRLPHIAVGGRATEGDIGWIGGVLGGVSGLAGAVPTLWCTMRNWDRDTQRAVFQSFNLTMHALTFSAYAVSGFLTADVARLFVVIAPSQLLPALLGLWLYSRIGDATFRRIVLLLLSISGVVLLVSSLPGLI